MPECECFKLLQVACSFGPPSASRKVYICHYLYIYHLYAIKTLQLVVSPAPTIKSAETSVSKVALKKCLELFHGKELCHCYRHQKNTTKEADACPNKTWPSFQELQSNPCLDLQGNLGTKKMDDWFPWCFEQFLTTIKRDFTSITKITKNRAHFPQLGHFQPLRQRLRAKTRCQAQGMPWRDLQWPVMAHGAGVGSQDCPYLL